MKILRVDYRQEGASKLFCKSLTETGFGVIGNHPISKSLVEEVYAEWKDFFSSSSKADYLYDPKTQAGYFPFRSENAKSSKIKDLKEFFHIYPNQTLPKSISAKTIQLFSAMLELGTKLLHWIHQESPEKVRVQFSNPLPHMVQGSSQNLFRILYYPPLTGAEEEGAIRAAAHEDINLITLLPASTEMGLQVLSTDGQWFEVPGNFGDIVVNVGDMLQEATSGYYRSATHRVVNPLGDASKKSRYSMPLFIHPRPEVRLSEKHTAETYLKQRLMEIGLA